MPSIYETEHEPEVARVLERMQLKMSEVFGVTVQGNRCTVRFNMDNQLADVHMIIENVTTPKEHREEMERASRMRALIEKHKKKFPDLEAELYYAETGEWSK